MAITRCTKCQRKLYIEGMHRDVVARAKELGWRWVKRAPVCPECLRLETALTVAAPEPAPGGVLTLSIGDRSVTVNVGEGESASSVAERLATAWRPFEPMKAT